jgi:NAD(P)H dehydrogenase (quinone)
MLSYMIFVSGANGQLAKAVITTILSAGRAASLVVGTRDVNSPFASELAGQGVDVRHADFRDPALMRRALQGVEKALLIPTYDANDVRLRQNLNAVEAARAAGVRHVVYTSFLNAESARVEHSRLVHFPTEKAIRASGLDFTILRHALYADILVGDLQATLATGLLQRSLGTVRCAYVARADLGVSAAQVLMRNESSDRVYSETMERTYSGDEIAAEISAVFGRPVRYRAIASADWPHFMTEKWGVPPEVAKSTLGTMQAIEAGEFDIVSPDYRDITGRPARSLREFLEAIRG